MANMSRRAFLTAATAVGGVTAMGALAGCSAGGSSDSDAPQDTVEEVAREIAETMEADIVVVGTGTAGLIAAVRASELGARVISLEKNGSVGGTSVSTEGVFGVLSRIQKEKGIETTPDDIFQGAMDYHHWAASGPVLRTFVDSSGDTIDWLIDEGIQFTDVRAIGKSAQVWHCYNGTAGENLIAPLESIAEENGVQILTSTPVVDLVADDSGNVTGVVAQRDDDSFIQVNASAVILATGGYADNAEMFKEFTDNDLEDFVNWGVPGRDGDGIAMGRAVGGRLHYPGAVMYSGATVEGCTKFYDIPNMVIARQPNIRVNAAGQRFFNEGVCADFTAYANALTSQTAAFSIIDQDYVDLLENVGIFNQVPSAGYFAGKPLPGAHDGLVANENVVQADTIEELAEALGIDPEGLAATVEEYNAFCEAGVDAKYGKSADYLQPIRTAPFYGARMIRTLFATVGGLDVNENMQVVAAEGGVIGGLYACGGDASSIYGNNYDVNVASGSQQGWAANSGRLAAEHAVSRL